MSTHLQNVVVAWARMRVKSFRAYRGLPDRALTKAERDELLDAMEQESRKLFIAAESLATVGSLKRRRRRKHAPLCRPPKPCWCGSSTFNVLNGWKDDRASSTLNPKEIP